MAQVLNNPVIVGGTGGGPVPVPEYEDHGIIWNGKCRIRYFDIDGTLLKLEYVHKGGYTAPPAHGPIITEICGITPEASVFL